MTESSAVPLPGVEVLPGADPVMDRHLHLAGSPDVVWPWVEQLGKGRAGWYLPRVVETVVPRGRRAARRVDARWLGLQVGDTVADWGPGDPTFEVLEVDPPHHLVYWSERPRRARRGVPRPPMRLTWALAVSPDGPGRSHLHLRLRLDLGRPAGPVATYGGGALDALTVWLMGRGLDERLRESADGPY
jgi:hypothetical protein